MLTPLSKLLIIIIMLLSFTGQAMASQFVVSNQQTTSTLQQLTPSLTHKTVDSQSNESNDEVCCDIECCEGECICPANTCASFVFLDLFITSTEMRLLSEQVIKSHSHSPQSIIATPFRPPIFISLG